MCFDYFLAGRDGSRSGLGVCSAAFEVWVLVVRVCRAWIWIWIWIWMWMWIRAGSVVVEVSSLGLALTGMTKTETEARYRLVQLGLCLVEFLACFGD